MIETHASRFELMRLLARELSEERARSLEAHLASCKNCRKTHNELQELQARGQKLAPPPPWISNDTRRFPLRIFAGVLAAAAAVAFFVLAPPQDGVRSKGRGALQVHCRAPNNDRPQRCESGEHLAPGTALMFEAHFDSARYLMLLGRDDDSSWRAYFPRQGETSVLVAAGTHDFMGASLVLDGAPGEERFVLYASERSFERRDLEGTLPDSIEKIEVIFIEDQEP